MYLQKGAFWTNSTAVMLGIQLLSPPLTFWIRNTWSGFKNHPGDWCLIQFENHWSEVWLCSLSVPAACLYLFKLSALLIVWRVSQQFPSQFLLENLIDLKLQKGFLKSMSQANNAFKTGNGPTRKVMVWSFKSTIKIAQDPLGFKLDDRVLS